MNAEDLRNELNMLINVLDMKFFALTTAVVDKPIRLNTVGKFKPAKQPGNAELFKNELVPFVVNNPNRYFVYYKKTTDRIEPWKYFEFDNRDDKTVEPINTTSENMDNRTKEEMREDQKMVAALNLELGELRAEVRALNKEIERLKEELEDALAEAEENANANMADQNVSMVGQVAQVLPSILDKWFSLQEEKNALMREQLKNQYKAPAPQPGPMYQRENNNGYENEEY